MCGIHGFTWDNKEAINKMVKISHSRGPDGNGTYTDNYISLGHNLLAITEDAKLSSQPWHISDDKILCFNGEIYNYKELRVELEKLGHSFETDGDTEVLAKGLLEWGDSCIDKLDGMFGISLYNKSNKTLTLARDSSGTKPVYWASDKRGISFSSSLKSIFSLGYDRKLDKFGYKLYDAFGYVPGPKTLVKDINKLYPGQCIKFDILTGKIIQDRRIDFTYEHGSVSSNFEDFRSAVSDSVRKCIMGKRQVGLYLSGGLDSNMILHELVKYENKPKTFTTRFETKSSRDGAKSNDDADVALESSKIYNTEHTELLITTNSFLDVIDECALALEEPRHNKNTPAYYLLNKELARQGIVVTLSGDGGDEVLTGYERHYDYINANCNELCDYWPLFQHGVKKDKDILDYIKSWFPISNFTEDILNNQLYLESLLFLPEDYLIRNDKLGMHFSMEARFPFTTNSFKKYALSIPSKLKYNENYMKALARNAYNELLPSSVINKRKSGWSVSKHLLINERVVNEYIKPTLSEDYYKDINEVYEIDGKYRNFPVDGRYKTSYVKVMNFKTWAKNFKITI